MHRGIRSKLIVMFSLLIVISLVNFLFTMQTERQASEQLRWVNHTHLVLTLGESFMGYVRDAETGQRGFLLTHDPSYLEPYHSGVSAANSTLSKLKKLTSDNPKQQALLLKISKLVNDKFVELAETIRLAVSGEWISALDIVKGNRGKQLMDQLRLEMNKFEHEEEVLLAERQQAYEESSLRLKGLFIAEVVLLILMIFFISAYIQNYIVTPLLILAREAKRFEEGEEIAEVSLKSRDEIGVLANALLSMHKTIQQRTAELRALSEELKQERDNAILSSVTDPLTGLFNRRKFEEMGSLEIRRAKREGQTLALIMLDIDFFKGINDSYGHVHGDRVLKDVAKCLKRMLRRPSDFLFRMGGEEFVCLIYGEDREAVAAYAELLRLNIEGLRIENKASKISKFVTLSVGVSILDVDAEIEIYDLLQLADERMYLAKSMGRNRVVVSDEG